MDTNDHNLIEYINNPETDGLLEIENDEEFEKRLAAYNGPGDKDYMRITRKRIMDVNAAYEAIDKANSSLHDAIDVLYNTNKGTTRARALSLAITKIEEALMWADSVAYATAPHDMNSTDPITDAS